ncbi:hypothetical protein APHAL10511_008594 [Amanita phalloides]|nr:hypothetical protein APHAL10511_008594 [Amanita phalloides]
MTDPVPGVKYRIQSLDYQAYLELADGSSTVRLRSAKETDRQCWQFERGSGSSSYYVRNVANSTQYLYFNTSNSTVITYGGANTSYSLVNVSYQDDAYKLSFYYTSTNYYFYTVDNTTTVSATSTSQNVEPQKWRLVPVTSQQIYNGPLQSGTYRIRSLNGVSLLTMPSGQSIGSTNVYVRSQDQSDQGAYQRWTVTRQQSGLYAISNAGTNSYLGCNATALVGDGIVGLQNVYLWDIYSAGGFAWSLRIPAAQLSVGAADYEIEDEGEMSLVPSDNTPSQIWFMENVLQNVNDQTIYMNAFGKPWRIAPGTAITSKFKLKYIDANSAHFTLTYVAKTTPAPVVADVGGYLGLAGKGTEFVLLEKDEGSPGYIICRPDTGRPYKVVSGRTTTDINQNSAFAIENVVAGDAAQMWTLVAA